MAALVQTIIPQQSGTVPVLQSRPSSSSGSFPSSPQPQPSRSMSWNSFNPPGGSASYRGHPVVAPYATSNPPHLSSPANRQSWSPQLRPEHRTSSAPSVPQGSPGVHHSRLAHHPAAGSVSSSSNSSALSYHSKDDSAIPSKSRTPPLRPLSTANLASPSSHMASPVSKPSPDRYRRGNRRTDSVPPGHPAPSRAPASSLANDPSSYSVSSNSSTSRGPPPNVRPRGHSRVSSADETGPEKSHPELAKRYRRRSWGTMDNANLINMQLHLPVSSPISSSVGSQDYFDQTPRPCSAHSQRDVSGSNHSAHSSTSSVRETSTNDSMSSTSAGPARPDDPKRTSRPSPLSKPMPMDSPSSPSSPQPAPTKESSAPSPAPAESPATKRLAEIKSEPKKPGKSRLRRAFSFGSASELVKASSQNNANKKEAIEAEKARRDLLKEQLGPEQAAIAEQQEASGLGESIYSHHGHLFGSTDDLSVSSTASSASVMLRKMGKGMKRSTRSFVGLFRPKSLASVKSTDGALIEPTAPHVSVVNIEAERENVTVNPDPQDHPRGATVFPKVERDSEEARRSTHEGNPLDDPQSRKSIVGGDRERAEVLAAVRKGILKKTQSDSVVPTARVEGHNGSDSPHSSVPSTPEDQTRSGNKRHDGVKIAGDDDFLSDGRLPGTDATASQAELSKSLVFSPRIQFHETWPSGEYDRRGDIATCNRLTPLLAQQIKEELNNFKMEMEVHETSKVYTHFL